MIVSVSNELISKSGRKSPRLRVWSVGLSGAIGELMNTKTSQHMTFRAALRTDQEHTWKARRSRNTRSYASLGGNRFNASKTTSFSSGMRSSTLCEAWVSTLSIRYLRNQIQITAGFGEADCFTRQAMDTYFNPSFRYPAASTYHLASGIIHRFSHGRFMI